MAIRHVGADDEEQIGAIEILVGARRPVGSQRQLVAAAGTGHAQAGIGFHVAGADEALGQLVDQVLRLQRHLARHIERDRVRPVAVEHGAQPPRGLGDRDIGGDRHVIPARLPTGVTARLAACLATWLATCLALAQIGAIEPSPGGDGLGAGAALGAEPAEIGRVRLVAGQADDAAIIDVEHDAAADAAIRASAFDRPRAHRAMPACRAEIPFLHCRISDIIRCWGWAAIRKDGIDRDGRPRSRIDFAVGAMACGCRACA